MQRLRRREYNDIFARSDVEIVNRCILSQIHPDFANLVDLKNAVSIGRRLLRTHFNFNIVLPIKNKYFD